MGLIQLKCIWTEPSLSAWLIVIFKFCHRTVESLWYYMRTENRQMGYPVDLSGPRLSRITAYLEVKILPLPKHENLTTSKKILWIIPTIFSIYLLTSRVQLHINLLNVVVWIIVSSIFKIWYVGVRISRSISKSPFEFEITRVDCI